MKPTQPYYVGPYRVVAELGRGGMGVVYLALGEGGRLVALKQVRPQFLDDDEFRARFQVEVVASRLVSSQYTVDVIDADPDADIPWLASDFVYGPTLTELITATGGLTPEAVRALAAGLTTALSDIHATGLIHRDLKPSNVILTPDGPRVIDFGIAKAAETPGGTELTHTGWLVGAPAFMSPEQASSAPVTAASDIFTLGTLLVVAATGNNPFDGAGTMGTLYNVVNKEPDLSPLPAELRDFIAPCLRKDPEQRPDLAQLREQIGTVTSDPWPAESRNLTERQYHEVGGLLRSAGNVTTHLDNGPTMRLNDFQVTQLVKRQYQKNPSAFTGVTMVVVVAMALGLVGIAAAASSGDGDSADSPDPDPTTSSDPGYEDDELDDSPSPVSDIEAAVVGDCFYDYGTEDDADLEAATSCEAGTFEVIEVVEDSAGSCTEDQRLSTSVSFASYDRVLCLSYQHGSGDAYYAEPGDCVDGDEESDSYWDQVSCETGNFEVLERLTGGSEDCSESDYHTYSRSFTVTDAEYLDVYLCLSMNYPDDIGYAPINTCLYASKSDDHGEFEFTDCGSANAIVTGRTDSYDEAFCGNDGWAAWEIERHPDQSYTVCWRDY